MRRAAAGGSRPAPAALVLAYPDAASLMGSRRDRLVS
jgi:hypothetical protein